MIVLHLRNITVSSVWSSGSRSKPVNRIVPLQHVKNIEYDDQNKVIRLCYTNETYETLNTESRDTRKTQELYNSLVTELKKSDNVKVIEW